MLLAQLDYVYFSFGLILFLLGSVCVTMSREGALPTPWWLLGAFAFTHGLAQWIQLLALARGAAGALLLVSTLVVAVSFGLLLEFARRTSRVLGRPLPGAWIHSLVAAATVGLVVVGGLDSLDAVVRLVIGAPAIFWTATLFFVAAARTEGIGGGDDGRRARLWGGAAFGVFGLSAGLVVPPAPFVPTRWPSPQAFLAWTGVPIQLVRAVAVSGMAMSVWALAVSFDPRGRVLRKRRVLFWVMAGSLVALLAAGWVFTEKLGRLHQQRALDDAESSAAQTLDHLTMEMAGADRAAGSLAYLVERFHVFGGAIRSGEAAGAVDAVAKALDDALVYLLDPQGRAIDTSNRRSPESVVGMTFARRPYFEDACAGKPGRFTGVGAVSGIPGYFASEPVRDASRRIVAVAVVKQNLGPAQLGPAGTGRAAIVTADGRVMVASRPGDAGRRLWGPPSTSPLLEHEVKGTEWVSLDGARQVAVRRPLPGSDWSLVVLRQEPTQVVNRLLGIVITLLLGAVVLGFFVAMQRQLGAESRLTVKRREAEGRAREMARRADTDALTGVLNRAGFNDVLAREVSRARRYGQPLSVIIADIDHFKRVNDEFGHPAGDQVLVRTAKLLSSCVREADVVARWGGEEFAIVAPMTPEDGATSLAEKLRSIMAATHLGPRDTVTASFGVAALDPVEDAESLVRRADAALYEAKQSGRNRVRRAGADGEGRGDESPVGASGPDVAGDRVYANTGFGPVDEEHEALSRALEDLVLRVNSGKVDEVRVALGGVIQGIADHFAHEESLMASFGYPSRKAHEEAHAVFLADVRKALADLEATGITPDFRRWAVARLPGWFRFHIFAHDVGLGQFLLRAGASEAGGGRRAARRDGATRGDGSTAQEVTAFARGNVQRRSGGTS